MSIIEIQGPKLEFELFPCPFCGATNQELRGALYKFEKVYHAIYCSSCGTYGPLSETESGAIEKWNARPENAELAAWLKKVNP